MKKENIKYIIIFLFSFFSMSFIFSYIDGDVLWNYGFSYAISKGEIPYNDFNMIITPFYPFLMSLPFHLFGNSIFVFYLINSFIITYMFYLLFKMYNHNACILLIFLFFPFPAVIFPTYNLFLIFLVVILLYFEKNNKNDYIIGIILAIAVLTKQTVGFFLIFPSFYYLFKDNKKIIKRLLGFIGPCIIFLIYLIISKSLSTFLDLCLFGLLDFTEGNGKVFSIFSILGLIMIIIIIYKIINDRNNLDNYYILAFSTILLPLFDINHFLYFLFIFILLFIEKIKLRKVELYINCIVFSVFYSFMFFALLVGFNNIEYPNHYRNFETRFLYNGMGEFKVRDEINNFIKNNKNKEIVFLCSDAYFYKITNELLITEFDLLNKGNHGYNGTKKLKDKIDKLEKGTIFIIDNNELIRNNSRQQINKEVINYAIKQSELIDKIEPYYIYSKK